LKSLPHGLAKNLKETFRQMARAIENVSQNETAKEPIPFQEVG